MFWRIFLALSLMFSTDAYAQSPAACAWPDCPAPQENQTVLAPAIYGGDYDPFGIIFVDVFKAFLGAIHNGRDDDQDSVCNTSTDPTDKSCDAGIQLGTYTSTTYTLTGNTAAYGTTLNVPDLSRYLFCRDSSTNNQCVSGGTCAETPSATHPMTIIMRDVASGYYYPLSVTGVSACTGAGTTLTIAVGQEVAFDSGVDDFQGFFYDVVHPNQYFYNYMGQYIATIPWDFIYRPKTGGMTNGNADTDCNGDAAWVENDAAGAKSAGTFSFVNAAAANSLYGNSCQLTGRTTAGSYLETPFWAPAVNGTDSPLVHILCSGIVYSASSNATTTIRASYGGGNGYIADQTLYIYDGGTIYSSPYTFGAAYGGSGGVTTNANQLAQPRMFAIRATALGAVPSYGVRITGSGTGNMWLDDVFCSRLPQNAEISALGDMVSLSTQPLLFPNGARIRPAAVGDSLFSNRTIPNGKWNYSTGIESALTSLRPDVVKGMSLVGNNFFAHGALSNNFLAQSNTADSANDKPFRWGDLMARKPSVVFDDTGAADFIFYYGRDEYIANVKAMRDALKARGINYIKIGPHPWHVDTTGGTMCHASAAKTCGAFALDFSKALAAFGVAN